MRVIVPSICKTSFIIIFTKIVNKKYSLRTAVVKKNVDVYLSFFLSRTVKSVGFKFLTRFPPKSGGRSSLSSLERLC